MQSLIKKLIKFRIFFRIDTGALQESHIHILNSGHIPIGSFIGGVAFVGAVALTYLTGGALAPVFIGMAGSILLDGVVEGAISSANGGSFWKGFTNGAANGAMWGWNLCVGWCGFKDN